ncbi:zinc-binding protein A33-like [Protopterus annectens]|uniref:zinc-binding protein A33-like n=1 Tax=Protopterus annectens TaxID=7888 RepID=UPI001CF9B9E4|nr:zinc-binding protein A33-like [Protopterus annectens]
MATAKITDDNFLCPVCLDLFKEPVILECGHHFCKSCIDKAWNSQDIIMCPECRHEFPAKKYIVNRLLSNIVETAERAQQCEEAEKLYQQQKTQCVLQSHECLEHKELLKVFCQEDGSPACVVCMISSKHAGHKFLPLQEAVNMFQENLKTAETTLKHRMNNLNEHQKKQEQLISGIQDEVQSLEQHITSEFAKLRQFLQDKEQQLIQQLKEEAEGFLEKMAKNLEKIEEMNEAIQKHKSNIESTLQQDDSVLFFKGITDEIKSIAERLEEEEKEEKQNKVRKGVFNAELIYGSLSLGVYRAPHQYRIWKEMLSVINPGLSHLTLDPNTAHPGLTLSEDLTSVTYGASKLQFFDNPKRYDSHPCVLGSQGFTSGRHYWEVEVGCKMDWHLGVTTEFSNRKGIVAMNPKCGYWVISLTVNMYHALDLSIPLLGLSVKPQKIGVYLDYEGGQVSFYNADNMSHIYTFTDTFTERLYPYFWVGFDSEPLNQFQLKL